MAVVVDGVEEVEEYCRERGNGVDAQRFVDHYEANDWMRGKAKVKELQEAAQDQDAKVRRQISENADFITQYCYTEEERLQAIEDMGPDPEITRFKGLGEISPDEFKTFIGPDIRLEQVSLHKSDQVAELLEYYMGKNTMDRQEFIINNLVIEEDLAEEDEI